MNIGSIKNAAKKVERELHPQNKRVFRITKHHKMHAA